MNRFKYNIGGIKLNIESAFIKESCLIESISFYVEIRREKILPCIKWSCLIIV